MGTTIFVSMSSFSDNDSPPPLGRVNKRTLEDLGSALKDDESDTERVRDWDFVVDGPSVLVPSSSGVHLRIYSHHLAVAPALRGPTAPEFVACRIGKSYAGQLETGGLTMLYRGSSLDAAIEALNESYERHLAEGIEEQPPGQGPVSRGDFQRAIKDVALGNERVSEAERFGAKLVSMKWPPEQPTQLMAVSRR